MPVTIDERYPREVEGRDVTVTGMVLFYDAEEAAEELAARLKTWAKHADLRGNPHFRRFSIVRLPEPANRHSRAKNRGR